MRGRHIVICALPGCTVFFHVISQTARFSIEVKKKVKHSHYRSGVAQKVLGS